MSNNAPFTYIVETEDSLQIRAIFPGRINTINDTCLIGPNQDDGTNYGERTHSPEGNVSYQTNLLNLDVEDSRLGVLGALGRT